MDELNELSKYAGLEDHVVKANDVFKVGLVNDPQQLDEVTFHPEFTHQIFGDEEIIFGYKKVSIQLYFTTGSLKPYFTFKVSGKCKGSEEPLTDIDAAVKEWLPENDFLTDLDRFRQCVVKDKQDFRPIGENITEYNHRSDPNRSFIVTKGTSETPDLLNFHRRFQTFSILEIDASRFLDEDPHWDFFYLFEKVNEDGAIRYNSVGYVTVYPFYVYPDYLRPRISQFLILRPYQKQGHGSRLYEAVFQHYSADPKMIDITVEDPAEGFQNMRRLCDVRYLTKAGLLTEPPLQLLSKKEKLEELHKKSKLNLRQLTICLEILAFKEAKKDDVKKLRLLIKERIFKEDDGIEALERDARFQALDQKYQEISISYRNLVKSL